MATVCCRSPLYSKVASPVPRRCGQQHGVPGRIRDLAGVVQRTCRGRPPPERVIPVGCGRAELVGDAAEVTVQRVRHGARAVERVLAAGHLSAAVVGVVPHPAGRVGHGVQPALPVVVPRDGGEIGQCGDQRPVSGVERRAVPPADYVDAARVFEGGTAALSTLRGRLGGVAAPARPSHRPARSTSSLFAVSWSKRPGPAPERRRRGHRSCVGTPTCVGVSLPTDALLLCSDASVDRAQFHRGARSKNLPKRRPTTHVHVRDEGQRTGFCTVGRCIRPGQVTELCTTNGHVGHRGHVSHGAAAHRSGGYRSDRADQSGNGALLANSQTRRTTRLRSDYHRLGGRRSSAHCGGMPDRPENLNR
jgi:hypothetical protein